MGLISDIFSIFGAKRQEKQSWEMWRAQTDVDSGRFNTLRKDAFDQDTRERRRFLDDRNLTRKQFVVDRRLDRRNYLNDSRRTRNEFLTDASRTRQEFLVDAGRTRAEYKQDRRHARKQFLTDQANYLTNARGFAEKAGFNPLAVLGMVPSSGGISSPGGSIGSGGSLGSGGSSAPAPSYGSGGSAIQGGGGGGGPGFAPGAPPQMSNAMSQALMQFGGSLDNAIELSGQNQSLTQRNVELNEKVSDLTLRPPVSGIYASREVVPPSAAQMGYDDASSSGGLVYGSNSGLRDGGRSALSYGIGTDPTRDVDRTPVISDAGYITIDNPKLSSPFNVPAVNGEVLDLGQAAVVGGSYVASKVFRTDAEKQKIGRDRRAFWADVRLGHESPKRYGYKRYKDYKGATPMGYSLPFWN